MKTTLAVLAFIVISSCTTVTETRPDGTVVTTRSIDIGAFNTGAAAVTTLGGAIITAGESGK